MKRDNLSSVIKRLFGKWEGHKGVFNRFDDRVFSDGEETILHHEDNPRFYEILFGKEWRDFKGYESLEWFAEEAKKIHPDLKGILFKDPGNTEEYFKKEVGLTGKVNGHTWRILDGGRITCRFDTDDEWNIPISDPALHENVRVGMHNFEQQHLRPSFAARYYKKGASDSRKRMEVLLEIARRLKSDKTSLRSFPWYEARDAIQIVGSAQELEARCRLWSDGDDEERKLVKAGLPYKTDLADVIRISREYSPETAKRFLFIEDMSPYRELEGSFKAISRDLAEAFMNNIQVSAYPSQIGREEYIEHLAAEALMHSMGAPIYQSQIGLAYMDSVLAYMDSVRGMVDVIRKLHSLNPGIAKKTVEGLRYVGNPKIYKETFMIVDRYIDAGETEKAIKFADYGSDVIRLYVLAKKLEHGLTVTGFSPLLKTPYTGITGIRSEKAAAAVIDALEKIASSGQVPAHELLSFYSQVGPIIDSRTYSLLQYHSTGSDHKKTLSDYDMRNVLMMHPDNEEKYRAFLGKAVDIERSGIDKKTGVAASSPAHIQPCA